MNYYLTNECMKSNSSSKCPVFFCFFFLHIFNIDIRAAKRRIGQKGKPFGKQVM